MEEKGKGKGKKKKEKKKKEMGMFSRSVFMLSSLWLLVLVGFVWANPFPFPIPTDSIEEDIQYSSSPEAKFLKDQYSLCPGPDHGLLRVKNPFLYKWVGSYYNGFVVCSSSPSPPNI